MKQRSFIKGLISVIIPSYNSMSGNEQIDRLLSSIMTQTYTNFEIIVVDSFSVDDVRKVCEKSARVRFFQLRSNISEARNLGLEKARGEFLIFLDCDQVIPPKLFEECISLARLEGADCVVVEIECIPNEPRKHRLIDCAAMHDVEVRAGIGTTGTKLPLFYSSDVVRSERFPQKVQLGEDFLFASRVMKQKPKVARASLRILHCEDSAIRGLVVRSWHYGGDFVTLQKDSHEAYTFLRNISVLDFVTTRRLLSSLSSRPKVIFPFAVYLFIKYAAFALGYLNTKLFLR